MRRGILILLALMVASCGVQRPLIKPAEIPAYREEQRKKREKIEQEQREFEESVTAREAEALKGVTQ